MKQLFSFITEISLRFRWVTVALAVALLVLGVVAFSQFNQELLPSIEFPQTFILLRNSGGGDSPDEARDLMTIPIETRLTEIEDVVNVESTTGGGFAYLQISNEFGLDQDVLREEIRAAIDETWLASGLARQWTFEGFSLDTFLTTADVTPAAIEEAWQKWPYILEDLDGEQLLSLPAETVAALPAEFTDALDADTRAVLLGASYEPGDAVSLPQSWLGLSTTYDLTPEVIETVLTAAPSMMDHFRDNDGELIESYLFAMPVDALQALPEDMFDELGDCSSQQLDQLIAGVLPLDPAQDLPAAWLAEPPEIITFSFADIPLAFLSISSADAGPAELRTLVEGEIVPRLMEVEGVADIPVNGGQLLPGDDGGEAEAEAEAAAAEPTATTTAEPTPTEEPDAGALPGLSMWRLLGTSPELSEMLGTLETYGDLSPELVTLVVNMVDGFGIPLINSETLLNDLRSEDAIQMMPAETLAWMPAAYAEGLSEDLRSMADARVSAETEYDAVGGAAAAAEAAGELPVYFGLFSQMGEQYGIPLEIEDPEGLTPEIVTMMDALIPSGVGLELLRPLSLAAWQRVPAETFGWLSPEFVESLDEDVRAEIEGRADEVGANLAAGDLPPFLAMLAKEPLLGGVRLCSTEDLTPEFIGGVAQFMPEMIGGLPAETLKRLPAETLAVVPPDVIADEDLRADLDELAASAGGLGGAIAVVDESAPDMPLSWSSDSRLPKTASEWVNRGAVGLLDQMYQYSPDVAGTLIHDLTPEVIEYVLENDPSFAETVSDGMLSFFSADAIAALPEDLQERAANAFVPDSSITRANGQASLLLTVYKDAEANTVEVSHAVFEELDAIEAEYGLTIVPGFEQASFIEESISGVTREGALGALFAIIVIYFFLHRSWRSTIVTAVSIPLSVMIAFAAMLWLAPAMHDLILPLAENYNGIWRTILNFFPASVTLNIMTLSGLTVAIGRVVDDSIVVLENIYRHVHDGDSVEKAVREGTRDVSIAIFASTVTTVVVFLPIGLVGGLIGSLFIPFGMAVSYALGASFIVAITVIPVLARWFVHREHMPEEKETAIQRWYTPALNWALSRRGVVLIVATVIFVVSMGILAQRPKAFIPPLGEPQISVSVSLPQGTSIIETNQLVRELEAYLEGDFTEDELEDYLTVVGSGGMSLEGMVGGGGVSENTASVDIAVGQGKDLDELAGEIRSKAEEIFGADAVTVSSATISETGFGGFSLVLSGDPDVLREIDAEVIAALSEVESVANISSSLELVGQVGDETILRVDMEPAVQYTAELETEDTLGVTSVAKEAVISRLDELGYGDTIKASEGFQSEVQTEGFASIINSLGVAILIVYFVMVLTFGSFVHPFTILFSLPLAVVGAALALWLTDRVLGLPAMVGLLMLVGIVVTNAIVLIDRVQSNRKQRKMNAHDALVEGARTRLRPILMTALAAIFALLPLAAQLMGPGGAIVSASLGTVVIGGLLTSTILTLAVVPVVYSLLDQLSARLNNRRADEEGT